MNQCIFCFLSAEKRELLKNKSEESDYLCDRHYIEILEMLLAGGSVMVDTSSSVRGFCLNIYKSIEKPSVNTKNNSNSKKDIPLIKRTIK